MRYRVRNDGAGFILQVEDGEDVVASVPAATFMEARRLQRVAVLDGIVALPKPAPAKKKGK